MGLMVVVFERHLKIQAGELGHMPVLKRFRLTRVSGLKDRIGPRRHWHAKTRL